MLCGDARHRMHIALRNWGYLSILGKCRRLAQLGLLRVLAAVGRKIEKIDGSML